MQRYIINEILYAWCIREVKIETIFVGEKRSAVLTYTKIVLFAVFGEPTDEKTTQIRGFGRRTHHITQFNGAGRCRKVSHEHKYLLVADMAYA